MAKRKTLSERDWKILDDKADEAAGSFADAFNKSVKKREPDRKAVFEEALRRAREIKRKNSRKIIRRHKLP
jgi:hypothetical protein